MTPFDYFFQLGAGFATGVALIGLPSLWLYHRYLGGTR